MAIIEKNGVKGKTCPTCRSWKSLDAFPIDPAKGVTQGGRHCRCRACHRLVAKNRRVNIKAKIKSDSK